MLHQFGCQPLWWDTFLMLSCNITNARCRVWPASSSWSSSWCRSGTCSVWSPCSDMMQTIGRWVIVYIKITIKILIGLLQDVLYIIFLNVLLWIGVALLCSLFEYDIIVHPCVSHDSVILDWPDLHCLNPSIGFLPDVDAVPVPAVHVVAEDRHDDGEAARAGAGRGAEPRGAGRLRGPLPPPLHRRDPRQAAAGPGQGGQGGGHRGQGQQREQLDPGGALWDRCVELRNLVMNYLF